MMSEDMVTAAGEIESLRDQLAEAQEALAAIRNGEVDAVMVRSTGVDQVFTLKSADRTYRLMVEQMNEGAATLGPDGTVLYCNRRFAEMVGRSLESTIGASLRDMVGPDDVQPLGRFLSTDPLPVGGIEVSLGIALPRTPARLSASSLTGEPVQCVCLVAMDLSDARRGDRLEALVAQRSAELERASANLRLSERLATIGTLSAGLGHDLGNLLLPVRARLDVLEASGMPESSREDLEAIRSAIEYLQRLASGLRLLAIDPEQGVRAGCLCVREWWNDCFPVLRDVLPSGAVLVAEFESGLPDVVIGRPALTQAVFNLVQNAGDVIRPRGHGTVKVRAVAAGGMVRISVTDDGPGMSEEVRRRCLEPYFTTKSRTISTGMGLPLVLGILTRAGGTVEVDSQPGAGTTFTLSLPAMKRTAAHASAGGPAALVTLTHQRTAAYITSVLRSLGCTIQTGANADPALWVLDKESADREGLRSFLTRRDAGHAVLTGDADGFAHPRLHVVPTGAEPAQLRSVLAEAVSALRS